MSKFIDADKILEATDGGLEIILHYYPEAAKALQNKNEKFKVRSNEKTPSASLKKLHDGNYVVTDFGGDQKPRNAIAICLLEEAGVESWGEACQFLAAHFNIDAEVSADHFSTEYQQLPAPEGMKPGYHYEKNKSISDDHRKVLGKFVTQELCDRYNLVSLKSYTYVKKDANGNLVQHIHSEKDHYPIFQFEMGDWQKRLAPKELQKQYRFCYSGNFPKDFVFGLEQCHQDREELIEKARVKHESLEDQGKTEKEFNPDDVKLPYIILCAGDRDALNVASLNYKHVIWFNSETTDMSHDLYKEIMQMTEVLYNLPDLDATGQRQAHQLAMKFLDIRTIELPKELLRMKDWRGNPCKDFRDWMDKYNPSSFSRLVFSALPYRFWDEHSSKEGGKSYKANNVQLYNFLQKNGFYRFNIEKNKLGYIYIRIEGNVVTEVDATIIKSFIHDFLKSRHMPVQLRNVFLKASHTLNENSFSNLDVIDIEFKSFTRHSQFIFFKNVVWEVTAKGIEEHRPGTIDRYVWADEVLDHKVKLIEKPFEVTLEKDTYKIDLKNYNCLFFNYLYRCSRMFWRKVDEEGEELTVEESLIEQRHMINKLYTFGYLLHRYKDRSKAWAVYAVDNLIDDRDINESHGGTGKSLGIEALENAMRTVTIPSRNPRIWDNNFIYEEIDRFTNMVLFDDTNQFFRFDNIYSEITGKWKVNPKNGKQFTLSFEESPKIAITSNYGDSDRSPSTARRKLFMVYSDYYHDNESGNYQETRRVSDDFGKNLFSDFTEEEWNLYFNTLAWSLTVFFKFEKINPPMDNVRERSLRNTMTDAFKDWADMYLSADSGRLDVAISRPDAFEDFQKASNQKRVTAQTFLSRIKAWCDYHNYILNPSDACNSSKKTRIIQKLNGHTTEMLFIQTKGKKIEINENTDDEDLPF